MILAGWVMMILSLTFVLGLTAFCFWRVLTAPPDGMEDGDSGDIHLAERDR
jgi:hypothetical protein